MSLGFAGIKLLRHYLKSLLDFSARRLLGLLHRSRIGCAGFYFLFSRAFWREIHAVAAGRVEYARIARSSNERLFLLRRNIHRLEKGLIMRPRRPLFALDYIDDTCAAFCELCASNPEAQNHAEVKWFRDVLSEYFDAVANDPRLQLAKTNFEATAHLLGPKGSRKPAPRSRASNSLCDFESLLALAKRRRSVRWFRAEAVPRNSIDKALEVARQAPSACNRQPYEFRVFDDKKLISEIGNISGGCRGFVENFPVLVVIVGNLAAYFHEKDRHIIYIDSALAAMGFVFALETLGLSSCVINWPDIENQEVKMAHILGLEAWERPTMLIAVGYPDETAPVPFSEKREIEVIRSFNRVSPVI